MNIIVFLAQKGVQRVSTKKQHSQVVTLSPCPVSKINTVPLTQLLQDLQDSISISQYINEIQTLSNLCRVLSNLLPCSKNLCFLSQVELSGHNNKWEL